MLGVVDPLFDDIEPTRFQLSGTRTAMQWTERFARQLNRS
jgi:hypothetical protein